MSRYDGLIIPRSYSEYINKTDAATLLQALQQSGVMDAAPTANSNHPVKSGGVYESLLTNDKYTTNELQVGIWTDGKKIYRKVITYNYTAGGELNFGIFNVVAANQRIKSIDIFTSLFNNSRYQFFSGGDWEGDWRIHFYRIERSINISLGASYAAYNFTLYLVIEYIEA